MRSLPLAVLLTSATRRSAIFMSDAASRTFTRGGDLLGTGDSYTAVEVVNVLGRWRSFKDWDSLGVLKEMDQLFDEDGNVQDSPALKRAWARWDAEYITGKNPAMEAKMLKVKGLPEYRMKNLPVWMAAGSDSKPKRDPAFGEYLGRGEERLTGPQPDAARSAARRGFCKRKGQVQRWWHNEGLVSGALPFTNAAMAESVGLSVGDFRAMEPPSWEACDVVFDALSRSQSGIVSRDLIDERRQSYEAGDGGFDADAFAGDLNAARATVAVSLAIFPGSLNLIFLVAFLQADGVAASLTAWDDLLAQVDRNVGIWAGMLQGPAGM